MVLPLSTPVLATESNVENDYMTQISRNGILEETLVVNFEDDKLIHIYPNGEEVVERLSDIVTITEIEDDTWSKDKIEVVNGKTYITNESTVSTASTSGPVDYIDNEPFIIDNNGISIPLDSTYIYTGYRTKDYVRSGLRSNNTLHFEYRGSEYDTGNWATNYVIIKHAIELYVAQNS